MKIYRDMERFTRMAEDVEQKYLASPLFPTEAFQEFSRPDFEGFCPRAERTVLIIDGVCFFRRRRGTCQGCKYDHDKLLVGFVWLLCDLLEDSK